MIVLNPRLIARTFCLICALVFAQLGVVSTAAIAGDDATSVQDECGPEEKPCTTTVVTLNKAGAGVATETKTAAAPPPQVRIGSNQIAWRIGNISGRTLNYRFYSKNRVWYWPAANKAFLLKNGRRRTTTITCIRGEKVCYGAWVAGRPGIFYGVGATGNAGCLDCCYFCTGVVSKQFILR